jgi:hypothetical protein
MVEFDLLLLPVNAELIVQQQYGKHDYTDNVCLNIVESKTCHKNTSFACAICNFHCTKELQKLQVPFSEFVHFSTKQFVLAACPAHKRIDNAKPRVYDGKA